MTDKSCPKCARIMKVGAPHSEKAIAQYECYKCGYIEPIYKENLYD